MLNLAYLLTRAARRAPDAPAILHGGTTRSQAWLDGRVGRLAGALLGLGLARGDRVGLIVETEPRGLESLLAPLRAGLTIVPMNPRLHREDYAFMLRDCGARALIVSRDRVGELTELRAQVPGLEHVIAIEGAAEAKGALDYEALVGAASQAADAAVDGGDLAWLFYTSGTTGRPKGAMHTHGSLGCMVDAHLVEVFPMAPAERLAHLTPLSHAAGLLAFHVVAGGGAHVFPTTRGFQPEEFYRLVERHRVTKTILVPTMIQRMLDAPWPPAHDISSLRSVMYGGAPIYVDRLKQALARFGPIFVQVYAQGEAPLACTFLSKLDHAGDPANEQRLASAGRECHGAEMRILDADDRPLAPGVTGEVAVRGGVVMRGYWNNPAATRETLRNGWLHTGDVGHMDADGFLYITARMKDLIIKGGSNIYPREIEEILYRHPAVREATVFGVPDPEWGEEVVAAVALHPGQAATGADLAQWCRASMSNFKAPARFHVLPDLAKSGYGKILKREVRQALYPDAGQWTGGNRAAAGP
ncbi:MAG: class I adenylate-forming enzyme family protein [Alphaproteobacteria bacterium]